MTPKNVVEKGKMYALNRMAALTILKKKGYKQITVDAFRPNAIDSFLNGLNSGLKLKDLIVFSNQFAVMLESGIPLLQTLDLLISQQKNLNFKHALEDIKFRVESGATFSSALAVYPRYFNELYVSMVKAGEISGALDKAFREIVGYLERSAKLRSQIKSATVYPVIVIVAAIGIVALLMVKVIPTFADQFASSGQALPGLTVMVILVSATIKQYILQIIGVVATFIALLVYIRRTPEGKRLTDRILMRIPITGDLIIKLAISRFSFTMSTMLSSGVSLLDALEICAKSSGNVEIQTFIKSVKDKVARGSGVSSAMENGIFPNLVVSMVAIGEQTGGIDASLQKVGAIYEDEVDTSVKNIMGLIQPALIMGIGGIVGIIVIAMYLPIFDAASTLE